MFTAKATRLFSILLLLGTVFLNSCKKGDDVTVVDPAYFRIINVSPSLGTYNVYVNDQILTTAALPFGGVIPYRTFEPAAYSLKFTTASSITSLLTKQVTLKSKELSSFYLIEKVLEFALGVRMHRRSKHRSFFASGVLGRSPVQCQPG